MNVYVNFPMPAVPLKSVSSIFTFSRGNRVGDVGAACLLLPHVEALANGVS